MQPQFFNSECFVKVSGKNCLVYEPHCKCIPRVQKVEFLPAEQRKNEEGLDPDSRKE